MKSMHPRFSICDLVIVLCFSFVSGCLEIQEPRSESCEDVGCPESCVGQLHFEDSHLESVVREAVGRAEGDLLYVHVKDLTILDTSVDYWGGDPGVTNLEGIGCLTSLRELSMDNNEIKDLSPLSQLSELRSLSLVSTPLSDVAPIAALQQLESLDLSNARNLGEARELTPLSSLENLRELNIAFGHVVDLSPIAEIASLEVLDVYANEIDDVGPLESLSSLRDIRLDENRVSDISPLASLFALEALDLSDNEVVDIGPLALNEGLSHGDRVELSGNPLDCLAMIQASSLRLLLERGVNLLVDCLPCLDNPAGLDCRCWLEPGRDECHCHQNHLECLCDDEPDHPDCYCYFYPDDPDCE